MTKQKTYPNGLRLVVETLKGFPSVVANITVLAGSNNDPKGKEGIAHFLEHMVFKGTKTKTSSEISNAFESVGSVINASTSNHFVKFYVKCIAEDTPFCFELLSEIFLHPSLPQTEIEKERMVILQELAMVDDDPERAVMELHAKTLYSDSPLGNPIGGFAESVMSITREDLVSFKKNVFVPEKTVISFAGDISFEKAEKLVDNFFETKNGINKPFVFEKKQTHFEKSVTYAFKQKQIMQNHVIVSFPGLNIFHKDATKLLLLSFFLGGGMSSRLFQRIREKHGLVYTIVSYDNAGLLSGDLEIYFATEPKNLSKAIYEIKQEIALVCKEGIPQEEFDKTKKFLKNLLLMMRENLDYIASSNAKDVLCYGKPRSARKEIKKMAIITKEELEKKALHIFDWEKAILVIVGNKNSKAIEKEWAKSN